jgi:type III pantothenate kinase
MRLLVDIGNTRVKWAWLDGAALRDPGAAVHRGQSPADYAEVLPRTRQEIEEVLLASVAIPTVTDGAAEVFKRRYAVPVQVAQVDSEALGIRNGYLQPRQLGVDRWLAMIAAARLCQIPFCVVDIGTALTLDVVVANGCHAGGLIVPGPALMRHSLLAGTQGIESAAALRPEVAEGGSVVGRDTLSCVERGARLACAGLVDGCLRRLRKSVNGDIALVLTGGDASVLRDQIETPSILRPLLVLEGLAVRFGHSLRDE